MRHSTNTQPRRLLALAFTFLLLSIVGCSGLLPAGEDHFESTATIVLAIDSANALGLPAFVDTLYLASVVFPDDPNDLPGGIRKLSDAKVERQKQNGTTIETELVSLELRGESRVGLVKVMAGSEHGLPPSKGSITEVETRRRLFRSAEFVSGNSSFDMNVSIQVGNVVLSNCTPAELEEGVCENPIPMVQPGIKHLPPKGKPYETSPPRRGVKISIYDSRGNIVGYILHTEHVPVTGCCQLSNNRCASPVSLDQCKDLGGTQNDFKEGKTCVTSGPQAGQCIDC